LLAHVVRYRSGKLVEATLAQVRPHTYRPDDLRAELVAVDMTDRGQPQFVIQLS
jgi:hypothetical protein